MREIRITIEDIERHKREILDQSLMVTIPTAAKILSVHPRTVKRLVRDGELSAYNRNGGDQRGTRILAAELREYAKSIRIHPDIWKE